MQGNLSFLHPLWSPILRPLFVQYDYRTIFQDFGLSTLLPNCWKYILTILQQYSSPKTTKILVRWQTRGFKAFCWLKGGLKTKWVSTESYLNWSRDSWSFDEKLQPKLFKEYVHSIGIDCPYEWYSELKYVFLIYIMIFPICYYGIHNFYLS